MLNNATFRYGFQNIFFRFSRFGLGRTYRKKRVCICGACALYMISRILELRFHIVSVLGPSVRHPQRRSQWRKKIGLMNSSSVKRGRRRSHPFCVMVKNQVSVVITCDFLIHPIVTFFVSFVDAANTSTVLHLT